MIKGTASTLPTPELLASSGPSPALQRLRTPDEELPAFDLGVSALEDKAQSRLPECWGHRGASASYRKPATSRIKHSSSRISGEHQGQLHRGVQAGRGRY